MRDYGLGGFVVPTCACEVTEPLIAPDGKASTSHGSSDLCEREAPWRSGT